jgi:hypothetical protein
VRPNAPKDQSELNDGHRVPNDPLPVGPTTNLHRGLTKPLEPHSRPIGRRRLRIAAGQHPRHGKSPRIRTNSSVTCSLNQTVMNRLRPWNRTVPTLTRNRRMASHAVAVDDVDAAGDPDEMKDRVKALQPIPMKPV